MAESKGTSKLISLEICIFALWWCKQNAHSLQCFVGPSSIQLNSNEKIADLVPWAPLYVYIIGNEIQVVTRYMKKYEAFFDKYGNIMNNYQQQPHGCGIWCTTVLSVFAQSWSITVSPDPTCEKEQLIVHRMLCCCCWAEENTPLYFHNTLYIYFVYVLQLYAATDTVLHQEWNQLSSFQVNFQLLSLEWCIFLLWYYVVLSIAICVIFTIFISLPHDNLDMMCLWGNLATTQNKFFDIFK